MRKGKKEVIEHHYNALEFVRTLNNISEDQWRTKIAEGKWTVAEIIGHLIPWDEFVLKKRVPYLFSDHEFPKGPDADITNAESASKTKEQEKKVIIDEFILVRNDLLIAIDRIPTSRWEVDLVIGQTRLSLFDYFDGLAKHDVHHFRQVKGILHQ